MLCQFKSSYMLKYIHLALFFVGSIVTSVQLAFKDLDDVEHILIVFCELMFLKFLILSVLDRKTILGQPAMERNPFFFFPSDVTLKISQLMMIYCVN